MWMRSLTKCPFRYKRIVFGNWHVVCITTGTLRWLLRYRKYNSNVHLMLCQLNDGTETRFLIYEQIDFKFCIHVRNWILKAILKFKKNISVNMRDNCCQLYVGWQYCHLNVAKTCMCVCVCVCVCILNRLITTWWNRKPFGTKLL